MSAEQGILKKVRGCEPISLPKEDDEETAAAADFFWDGTLTEEEEDQALLRAMEEADINDRVSLSEAREILKAPDG